MHRNELCQIASRLMSHPAAPFHEGAVQREIECLCAENGLAARRDRHGNILIRAGSPAHGRPIAFAAHMDHPGFTLLQSLGPRRWLARFDGGVPPSYFKEGTRLRLMPGAVPGKLGRRQTGEKLFEVITSRSAKTAPGFAVWEMKDFRSTGSRIYGRACDDLIGVAAAIGALIKLHRSGARVHALGLISRAEEVGFQGALALAGSGLVRKNALVISLETSREMPPVGMGRGVIVRVGDRASIFNSAATRFLTEVAGELASGDKTFRFQRALMSGGTCEATAYQEFGYETAAVCVALGNYHNCGPRDSLKEEFVSIDDLESMTRLLAESARRMAEYRTLVKKLPDRLNALRKEALRNLR